MIDQEAGSSTDSRPLSPQQKALQNAMAICRGMEKLAQYKKSPPTFEKPENYEASLTGLFIDSHETLFKDWEFWAKKQLEEEPIAHMGGPEPLDKRLRQKIPDAYKREQVRAAINSLFLKHNPEDGFFDVNGFTRSKVPPEEDDVAKRLAVFYKTMRNIAPFDHGNDQALDFFMTSLGMHKAFKPVYPAGIDFRRISDPKESDILQRSSNTKELTRVFKHLLDSRRDRGLINPDMYPPLSDSSIEIATLPFLGHVTQDKVGEAGNEKEIYYFSEDGKTQFKLPAGQQCLVTANGGLVPLDAALKSEIEAFIHSNRHIADFPPIDKEKIIGYLDNTEKLRTPGKQDVDGITVQDGKAPVICLDMNILTGLSGPINHQDFLKLFNQVSGASIFTLAGNEALKAKLIEAANGDERLSRGVEIAYGRITAIDAKLQSCRKDVFDGVNDEGKPAVKKQPVTEGTPKLFMCMGGPSSGKSAVKEIAEAHCGDNYVEATLDGFRDKSDLYRLIYAAGHHAGDYSLIEPFANKLRSMVAEHAKDNHYNVLYDGTSIPYQPRYGNIVKDFKKEGFEAYMTAIDVPILTAYERAVKRERKLPWNVTIDKHIGAAASLLSAVEDNSLSKVTLFDNTRDGVGNHYLVAESFNISRQEAKHLRSMREAGTLSEALEDMVHNRKDSFFRTLVDRNPGKYDVENLLRKNPDAESTGHLKEDNVSFHIYEKGGITRVLTVYDAKRMTEFMEKGQFNTQASGPNSLAESKGRKDEMAFSKPPSSWVEHASGNRTTSPQINI